MRTLLPLLLIVSFLGCKRPSWDTPVDAYLSFVRLAQKGNAKGAFEGLSTPTREALSARAEAASKASGGALRADAERHFFSAGPRPEEITNVEVLRQSEGAATLKVVVDDHAQEVQMVKEAGGWRVDLTNQLESSPAAPSP